MRTQVRDSVDRSSTTRCPRTSALFSRYLVYRLSSHIGETPFLSWFAIEISMNWMGSKSFSPEQATIIWFPNQAFNREGVVSTSLLFQKIGLDIGRERKGCDECATRYYIHSWGILVKLVICVVPEHWKIKILNLNKKNKFFLLFYVSISHPRRKK